MGSLTFDKLIIIGIIVMLIFGPEKLPGLAEQLAHFIRRVKTWTNEMKDRAQEELGEDFSVDDWRKLDPRQYDPRRIVRDAWNEIDAEPAPSTARTAAAGIAASGAAGSGASSKPAWAVFEPVKPAERYVPGAAPFDSEAT